MANVGQGKIGRKSSNNGWGVFGILESGTESDTQIGVGQGMTAWRHFFISLSLFLARKSKVKVQSANFVPDQNPLASSRNGNWLWMDFLWKLTHAKFHHPYYRSGWSFVFLSVFFFFRRFVFNKVQTDNLRRVVCRWIENLERHMVANFRKK